VAPVTLAKFKLNGAADAHGNKAIEARIVARNPFILTPPRVVYCR